MKDPISPRPDPDFAPGVRVVTDPRAADALVNPYTLRQLEPFLGRDCTVSEAARQAGEKPNTVLRRVRRFVGLGLLEVTREERRAGRAIKVYRSSAEVFFVPFEATSAETLESLMAERDRYYEDLLRRGVVRARRERVGTWGTRIYKDARGRLQIQTALTPEANHTLLEAGAPAVLSAWRDSVYLDFEDAKRLQLELFDLLKRFQQARGAGRYVVRLGLAPVLAGADVEG